MTYKEMIEKLSKGEALTPEEVAELGKITRPVDRFNELAQKKAELEKALADKEKEIADLKTTSVTEQQRLQDEVNAQLRELSGKVETLSKENSTLLANKEATDRLLKVAKLARDNVTGAIVKNTKYLSLRFDEMGVDLNDKEKVDEALKSLLSSEPEVFIVPVRGGSGTGGNPPSTGGVAPAKPVKDWSIKEKTEFIKENGADKYAELRNNQGE